MANLTVNVPDVDITDQGIDIPEVQDVLTGVLKDFNEAFGGNLNIKNVATPQGLLSADIAHYIALKNAQLAYLIAMFDPSTSQGRYLDALAQIYFIQRNKATPTVVRCECTGVAGYTLPKGSKAVDDNGYIYASEEAVTFGVSGTVEVNFICETLGAIDCPAGSLSTIHQVVTGWDAITNTVAGVAGNEEENDRQFEQRRYDSVSKNAQGSVAAMIGAIAELDGVTDVYVTENNTSETKEVGETSYELLPHSVYIAVVGGDNQKIADTIFLNKNAGSNMNGNTTIEVMDKYSYVYPYPTYEMTFNRPTEVPINFAVNIDWNDSLPAEIIYSVKETIARVFNGQIGDGRARIGGTIYAAKYYSDIAELSDFMNILSVFISKTSTVDETIVTMGIDEAPVVGDITVTLVGAPT